VIGQQLVSLEKYEWVSNSLTFGQKKPLYIVHLVHKGNKNKAKTASDEKYLGLQIRVSKFYRVWC
jgi:hypothetical protein